MDSIPITLLPRREPLVPRAQEQYCMARHDSGMVGTMAEVAQWWESLPKDAPEIRGRAVNEIEPTDTR